MNCAYHSHNGATVSCNGCGKPLCPSCDHRIKGFPYCQDCIVLGVDLLRSRYRAPNAAHLTKQTSPLISLVLSFICPGLGAAYNGQTHKALVHFGVSVGLFQLALLSRLPFFFLGVIGMWFYSMVDAWKTARLIKSGAAPDVADDLIAQRFSGSPKLWGILLVTLGTTFLLQIFVNLQHVMRALLPVALIGLGLFILRKYVFNRSSASSESYSSISTDRDFMSAVEDRYTSDRFDQDAEYSARTSARSWRNK
jgi:hypothetical protein